MSTSSTSNAPRIVVGVDGSPSSRAALRWSVRQAALTGGTAEAVIVRHAPTSTGMIGGFGQSPAETADEGVVADEARADTGQDHQRRSRSRTTGHKVRLRRLRRSPGRGSR